MDRNQKQELVSSLRQVLDGNELIIVAQQSGMTVSQVTNLRGQMREAGASYKVAKNTLVRLAVQGTKNEELSSFLNGPTALAFSQDPVAAAKVAVKFANDNSQLQVMGGILGGKLVTREEIETLSKLPSLDELRAKIISVIQTPATRVAGVLQAPAGQLARVFGAYGKTA